MYISERKELYQDVFSCKLQNSNYKWLKQKGHFLFHMTQSSDSGQFRGWLCSWTVSWRTQMFFIFVLSHPQHIGDFFCYSCKMDVGIPDVICRHEHVQQKRGGIFSCESQFITRKKPFCRWFQLFSTQGPLARMTSQAHALTDKGYLIDTNSEWLAQKCQRKQ